MTATLTIEQIERLEALEEAATPGEWGSERESITASRLACFAEVFHVPGKPGDTQMAYNDAALVAALRNAAPALLAMARSQVLDALPQDTLAELDHAREDRDLYLAALKAEAIAEAGHWSVESVPGEVFIGGIVFRVTRGPDGELVAEEVES